MFLSFIQDIGMARDECHLCVKNVLIQFEIISLGMKMIRRAIVFITVLFVRFRQCYRL